MRRFRPRPRAILDLVILLGLALFTNLHLPLALVFTDTMLVGGDMPAHNLLASHLRESLQSSGQIISWSPDWWCGFPMFQFYFPLPYLAAALLSFCIPFNIALKCIFVLGVYAMPAATYAASRCMRLSHPTPILTAIMSQLFLYSHAHTMWGGNIYSLLAGMMANSLGFPLMIITLGVWWRDAEREQGASLRSSLLFAALLLTHFFTAIMAALVLLGIPLLQPKARRRATLTGFAVNAGIAAGLTAWWWLPLFAKRAFSIAYGSDWGVSLIHSMPIDVWLLLPFGVMAARLGIRKDTRALALMTLLTLLAILLFQTGYAVSEVFVDIRLWPFVHFGLLWLAAAGVGQLVRARAAAMPVACLVFIVVLLRITMTQHPERSDPPPIRTWAEQGLGGFERQPDHKALEQLARRIDGTPGRLAHEYSTRNAHLGSPRIFESLPHWVEKPLIEGGIVNSSPTADHAYYVRCLLSQHCSGYSANMTPPTFSADRATPLMEWMNVSHAIVRSQATRNALQRAATWDHVQDAGPLSLFALNTHEGRYAIAPLYVPLFVITARPRMMALEWTYSDVMRGQPVVFVSTAEEIPPHVDARHILWETDFLAHVTQGAPSGDINTWYTAGPYRHSPIESGPTNLPHVSESTHFAGRDWRLIRSQSPIYPGKRYRKPEQVYTIAHTVILVPEARPATLHTRHDDGMRLWLNGNLVIDRASQQLTFRGTPVPLQAGRNILWAEIRQDRHEHFFHVRITDTNGIACTDLRVEHPAAYVQDWTPEAYPDQPIGPFDEYLSPDGQYFRFRTDAPGRPHMIKISYFPNWRVSGAERIFRVAPNFMLIYPEQEEIELTYGATASDVTGRVITAMTVLLLGLALCIRRRRSPAVTDAPGPDRSHFFVARSWRSRQAWLKW